MRDERDFDAGYEFMLIKGLGRYDATRLLREAHTGTRKANYSAKPSGTPTLMGPSDIHIASPR